MKKIMALLLVLSLLLVGCGKKDPTAKEMQGYLKGFKIENQFQLDGEPMRLFIPSGAPLEHFQIIAQGIGRDGQTFDLMPSYELESGKWVDLKYMPDLNGIHIEVKQILEGKLKKGIQWDIDIVNKTTKSAE